MDKPLTVVVRIVYSFECETCGELGYIDIEPNKGDAVVCHECGEVMIVESILGAR